jgi:hypothetical protein
MMARMLLRLLVLQLKVSEELLIVLEEKDGSLGGECVLGSGGLAGGRLPVGPEAGGGDVALVAAAADERTFVVVQTSGIKKIILKLKKTKIKINYPFHILQAKVVVLFERV